MDDLIGAVKQCCEACDRDRYHSPEDVSIGIATEAAELLELFRYKSVEEMRALFVDKREEIADAVADCSWHCWTEV